MTAPRYSVMEYVCMALIAYLILPFNSNRCRTCRRLVPQDEIVRFRSGQETGFDCMQCI